jgi:amino acid transporter
LNDRTIRAAGGQSAARGRIGPVLATLLVCGNMLGAGIFILPATLATFGSITVVAWAMAATGALLTALVLAFLARAATHPGGPGIHVGQALGPFMGFQSSLIYWVSSLVTNAVVALAAANCLASLLPDLTGPLRGAWVAAALIGLLTLANTAGVRFIAWFGALALTAGALPVAMIAVAGWWHFDPALFRASWNVSAEPAFKVIPAALVPLFWAFIGLESASVAAARVSNPSRNVPIATIAGMLLATVLYIGSNVVIAGVLSPTALARSSTPLTAVATAMWGGDFGLLLGIAVLIKATGTLAGWILLGAETARAGAARGWFPAFFGRLNRRGIPLAGLIVGGAVSIVIAVATASVTVRREFNTLSSVSAVLIMLVYVYVCAAVWYYTRAEVSPHRLRLRVVAMLAMIFNLGVLALCEARLLSFAAMLVLLTYPLFPLLLRMPAAVQHSD